MLVRSTITIPTELQDIPSANPGPEIDGEHVYPGDIFRVDAGEYRVVQRTTVSGRRSGFAVFDPATLSSSEYRANTHHQVSAWTRLRQGLARSAVIEGDEQTVAFVSRDLETGAVVCDVGSNPVGAMSVTLRPALQRDSISEMIGVLDAEATSPSGAFASVEPDSAAALATALQDQLRAVADRRVQTTLDPVPATRFWTAQVLPPVPKAGGFRTIQETLVAPGDKLLSISDPTGDGLLDVPPAVLGQGRCDVVVDAEHSLGADVDVDVDNPGSVEYLLYDLFSVSVSPLDSAALDRYRSDSSGATTTAHLQLLGRDAHVKPLETETYSSHVYRWDRGSEIVYLLSVARQETTDPRLEHPLALETAVFETLSDLLGTLRSPDDDTQLSQWVNKRDGLADTYEQLADSVEDIHTSRFDQ